jgi:UDP-glucose 4-epimerase
LTASERVLVTGGAGFIGSHTVDLLIKRGVRVSVVDDLSSGRREHVHPAAEFHCVDVASERLDSVFRTVQPTHVIHLAAQTSVPASLKQPGLDAQVNVMGTLNVLERCVELGRRAGRPPKVVVACSAAMYGEPRYLPVDEEHPRVPQSFYGLHKSLILDYLRLYHDHYGLPYTALVYSNVYGPRQTHGSVIGMFVEAALSGVTPLIFGDGRQTRDFIFVSDVARANHRALLAADGEVLNISTGREVSINELCDIVATAASRPLRPVYAPPRPGDVRRSALSWRRAGRLLNWRPAVQLREGVRRTLADARASGGELEVAAAGPRRR